MFEKHQKFFTYLAILVMAVIFYLILIFIYRKLGLPSPETIISWAQGYYERYGYWVVLVGALAEGILFLNWYLPGSVVVALGVIFAKQADLNVFLMLSLVILGFFTTSLINYAFGRFGWYHVFMKLGLGPPLEKVKSKIESKGLKILFTTYVHPNFGALAATSAGILRMNFFKFALYALISITLWNSLWTVVFYYFGNALLSHLNLLIIVGGIFVYLMFIKGFKETEKKLEEQALNTQ